MRHLNERITENIVRNRVAPYVSKGFIVEEQRSSNAKINKLLQSASKKGNGKGFPDFIIRHEEDTDFLMIVECKPDIRKHESQSGDMYADYAVDGALLYSSFLVKEYDVLAFGVSGQTEAELKATGFLQLKTSDKPKRFVDTLLDLPDLKEKYTYDNATKHQRYESLLEYNRALNQTLHNHKIRESDRSLLLSGILIALEHDVFRNGYSKYKTSKQLVDGLVASVVQQLENANLPDSKITTLEQAYAFIRTNATLANNKEFFIHLIDEVNEKINSFTKTYKFYDIFGEFYTEFLRYANDDKGLGIVLTPKHITELFCELGGISKESVVFDNCCGTGGFLISAMRHMLQDADHDYKKMLHIKEKQIVGIEFQDGIFPLVCSNMIIHGDGKTNIYNEDCFKLDVKETIRRKYFPTIGLLNPPFKTDKNDIEELEFVLNNLEGLCENALCVALLPMQCVLAQNGQKLELKKRLMKNHTLEAVVSLPNEIFYNSKVSVVTCGVVIRAHKPHPKEYKTYFGYWKDDGFIKRKNKGRVDGGRWREIIARWLSSYRNRESIPGLSITQRIVPEDEWCAEAYMETDYSKLKEEDFIRTVKNFVAFLFLNDSENNACVKLQAQNTLKATLSLSDKKWTNFTYKELFEIKKGKRLTIENMNAGTTPFIGSIDSNNGYRDFVSKDPNHSANTITVNYNGSVGEAFYQPSPFWASDDCNVLYSSDINQYIGLFLTTVIRHDRYRFNYGRKWHMQRMMSSILCLPSTDEGKPDWQFMENYIKSLPYSSNLAKVESHDKDSAAT